MTHDEATAAVGAMSPHDRQSAVAFVYSWMCTRRPDEFADAIETAISVLNLNVPAPTQDRTPDDWADDDDTQRPAVGPIRALGVALIIFTGVLVGILLISRLS